MPAQLRMRFFLASVATAIVAAVSLPAAAAAAPVADDSAAPVPEVVPREVLVSYEPESSPGDRADAREETGTRAIEGLGMPRAQLLRITDGESIDETVRELEAQPEVKYAEPNELLRPAQLPNDPLFLDGLQWGLFNDGAIINGIAGTPGVDISAPAAWNIEIGEPTTVVAVMDTGADLQHVDLVDQLWENSAEAVGPPGTDDDFNGRIDDVNGYDFFSDDPNPTDLSGHGTHVSGIALAEGDNGIGVTGVSQEAALMSLRICGTYTSGCPVAAEIQAINYAGAKGADVLNGSIEGGSFSQMTQDALLNNPNTLYVFAAGNGGGDGVGDDNDLSPRYPCAIDEEGAYSPNNVICVAATDQDDNRAGYSNFGAESVDLGAPGSNVLSTSSRKTFFSDDFQGGDFTTRWTNTQGPGWVTTGEPPLDSLGPGNVGITDSASANYAPDTVNEVTLNSGQAPLPAGYSSCQLGYYRSVHLGAGDSFVIEVLLNGVVKATGVPANHTARYGFIELNGQFDPGGQVQVRLRLTSDSSGEDTGVHMDDFELVCHGSPSDNGYEYLDGTSMATPMVSGAAALLFSRSPAATPAEVKTALLSSVDVIPDLTGASVSGGRLNAYRALVGDFNPAGGGGGGSGGAGGSSTTPPTATPTDSNSAPRTFFKRKPGKLIKTESETARVVFRFGSNESKVSFRCQLDSVEYVPCGRRLIERLEPARHVLKVKAVDDQGKSDPTAAVFKFRVKRIGD